MQHSNEEQRGAERFSPVLIVMHENRSATELDHARIALLET